MPVSFVHCNYCGESPSKDVKFVITSCRHVACGECYSAGRASPICMLCNRPCRVQAINSKMKNKEMFMDQAFTVQRLINQVKSRVTEEDDVQEVSMEENELSDAEKDACLLLENSVALEQFNQRLDDIFLMADKAINSNKGCYQSFYADFGNKKSGITNNVRSSFLKQLFDSDARSKQKCEVKCYICTEVCSNLQA
ncbi:hypothetical protein M3Y97_00651300 [Aphelenchoides bicaudatus]|nr:hypothetical protein M3Y97_00651300 [Aphelenchoides bicaudatus]